MKSIKLSICLATCFLLIENVQAQTWDEWMRQRKTQIKYLTRQIAALSVYAGKLKEGYEIASKGLNSVRDITNGEFNLHAEFFNSLSSVNPAIQSSYQATEIIACQQDILKGFNSLRKSESLSEGQRNYVMNVRKKVLDECEDDLQQLLLVITAGKLEMSDQERMKRLDKIYRSIKDKAAFTQYFRANSNVLILQKEMERESLNNLKNLYETN